MKRILGLVVGLAALGCGSTGQGSGNTAGAGAGGQAAGAAGASGAISGGGGASATGGTNAMSGAGGASGSGPAGGATNTPGAANGTVQFGRLFNLSSNAFEASARFRAKDAVSDYDCTQETFGDCYVSTCTENTATPTPAPYAGTITLSDGNMLNATLTAVKGENYPSIHPSVSIAGGEQVTVKAEGGEVPAFTATVAVPLVITVSSPVLDASGMAKASRNADLVLQFDNRAANNETGTKLFVQSNGGDPRLYCTLPTETGTATIPAAALGKLAAGTQLYLITERSTQVQAGDYAVSVIAYISAMTPMKSDAAWIELL